MKLQETEGIKNGRESEVEGATRVSAKISAPAGGTGTAARMSPRGTRLQPALPPAATRDRCPPAAAHSQSAGATSDSPKTKSLLFTRNLSNDISGRLTHNAYVLCIISVFLQYSKLKTIIKITKKIIKRKNIYTVLDNIK